MKRSGLPAGVTVGTLRSPARVRYRRAGLSFLMAFLMYMERGAIGAAAPNIMREFRIAEITMGWSVSAFTGPTLCSGFRVDGWWTGLAPELYLAGAIAWWSASRRELVLFQCDSLQLLESLFGVGEAASVSRPDREPWSAWLPAEQRAFA